nr:unnamed protein product [Callosobruchus analis]
MYMRLVLVLTIAAIAASQHCHYTPSSIPIDVDKVTYLVSFLAMEYDSYAVFYDCSSTSGFSYVLTRSKERYDALIESAVKSARQVSPFLPSPSKKLNCEIF